MEYKLYRCADCCEFQRPSNRFFRKNKQSFPEKNFGYCKFIEEFVMGTDCLLDHRCEDLPEDWM